MDGLREKWENVWGESRTEKMAPRASKSNARLRLSGWKLWVIFGVTFARLTLACVQVVIFYFAPEKRNETKWSESGVKIGGKSFEENLSRESIVLYMSMDFHGDDDLLTAHKGHQKMRHNAYTLLHVVLSFPNNIISSAIRSLGVCCVLLISHLMPNKTRRQ